MEKTQKKKKLFECTNAHCIGEVFEEDIIFLRRERPKNRPKKAFPCSHCGRLHDIFGNRIVSAAKLVFYLDLYDYFVYEK
jgi:hypothetical protein